MYEKEDLESLFFEPTISQLRAISNDDNIISSARHKLISHDKSFLGIKKKKYLESKEIFVLNHEQAFDLGKLLFNKIADVEESDLRYFHSEDLSWVAFLFSFIKSGNEEVLSNSQEEILQELIEKDNTQKDADNNPHRRENAEALNMPDNIDFVIGVNSGYNDEDIPTFYLVLKHEDGINPFLLTIDSYKFSFEEIEDYLNHSCDLKVLKSIIEKKVASKFLYQLKAFVSLYQLMSEILIGKEDFVPVCLDLYNLNRSLTSLKNDKNLKRRVESLIRNGEGFISAFTSDTNCSIFIDFIIRNNYVNLESIVINRDRVEELFMQKRSYQKVESIFPSFRKSHKNFQDYLEDQKEIMQKVIDTLREGDAIIGI